MGRHEDVFIPNQLEQSGALLLGEHAFTEPG
jgi:hypothetical protein